MMNQYERMEQEIQQKIVNDHDVDAYTWPGVYPLYYVTADGGCLCPQCCNNNIDRLSDPYDPQWYVVAYGVNWDDEDLYCDHCGERIESAYGDDE